VPYFLNQIFLVGLTAAALPVLIHLFSRRRTREVRFPSLEFLEEVSRRKVRRIQLRQFLLLLLRVLIIALFALAMAQPTIQSGAGGLGRGSSTVAVILDNSFSMAARDPARTGLPSTKTTPLSTSPVPEEGTVFETAKQRVLEIVSLLREGDRGAIVFAAAPVRLPYQTAITDLGLLRQEVERAVLEATPADLLHAVDQAASILAKSRTLNKELYIVSDFQRVDVESWRSVLGTAPDSNAAGRTGDLELPEGVNVYLVPARSLPVDNLAVERVRLDQLGADSGGGGRLYVKVANYSEEEAHDVVVRALPEGEAGEALGEAFLTVPPMGRTESMLLLRRLPMNGSLRISLAPDPLNWDNDGYLVTEQPGVRNVLVLSGHPEPLADPAARYLRLALDPSGNQEFFRLEVQPATDPSLANGLSTDVLVLLDVGRLPQATLESVERFHAQGGPILIVLGERVDPRTYNTEILPRLIDVEILGLEGDPARPDLYRSLRIGAVGHPIFQGFPAAQGANLTSARFQRILKVRAGTEARVLAEFSGALPALVEDRGTLLFTSALDGVWSDLPTSGAFVPLAHRMISYLITHGGTGDRLRPGEIVERAVGMDQLANKPAYFVDPQGLRTFAERTEREGKVYLKSVPLRLPGIYRLVREDDVQLGLFAVNLDPHESDLRPAPESWLPGLFDPPATVLQPEGEITRDLIEARFGRELWPLLLLLVLLLMVAESLIGRGRLMP